MAYKKSWFHLGILVLIFLTNLTCQKTVNIEIIPDITESISQTIYINDTLKVWSFLDIIFDHEYNLALIQAQAQLNLTSELQSSLPGVVLKYQGNSKSKLIEEYPISINNQKKIYEFKAEGKGTEVLLFSSPPASIFSTANLDEDEAQRQYQKWYMDPMPRSKQWQEITITVLKNASEAENITVSATSILSEDEIGKVFIPTDFDSITEPVKIIYNTTDDDNDKGNNGKDQENKNKTRGNVNDGSF